MTISHVQQKNETYVIDVLFNLQFPISFLVHPKQILGSNSNPPEDHRMLLSGQLGDVVDALS